MSNLNKLKWICPGGIATADTKKRGIAWEIVNHSHCQSKDCACPQFAQGDELMIAVTSRAKATASPTRPERHGLA